MRTAAWLALAAATTAAAAGAWRRMQHADAKLKEMERLLLQAQADAQRKEQQRQDERRGRVSAEKELRRVMDEKLDTSNGFYVQPLGHVQSCFRSCVGTPRQGLFAPSTRGRIVFQRSISPDTLVGLEHFTHVWVLFVFHKNTNGKNTRAHEGLRSDSHRFTFKAKISPPRLKERVGIFSTRSPHRPNPIGITLATIERVDGAARTVHLSALDLVDGTPVLDIKPYVPAYDSVPTATYASWVSNDLSPTVHSVQWMDPSSLQQLNAIAESSLFYNNDALRFRAAIDEVLQADVRSKDQTTRRLRAGHTEIVLDNARVRYRVAAVNRESEGGSTSDESAIEVLGVELVEPSVAIDTSTSSNEYDGSNLM